MKSGSQQAAARVPIQFLKVQYFVVFCSKVSSLQPTRHNAQIDLGYCVAGW
jgi:hypothetical protein